jgi:predicted RecA/RadA family phage recombinase
MKNFVQKGNILQWTVTGAAVTSGQAVLIGTKVGVCLTAGAVGETIAVAVDGVYALPKVAAQAQAQGVALYWDNVARNVTTTVGSNTLIGYAFDAALAADATVNVKLNG